MFSTGLPVVEGQDLERGGPASAGEVERAAGNRGAAGLHSAPTRHRYADTLCCSLSFCLSVRPSLWGQQHERILEREQHPKHNITKMAEKDSVR